MRGIRMQLDSLLAAGVTSVPSAAAVVIPGGPVVVADVKGSADDSKKDAKSAAAPAAEVKADSKTPAPSASGAASTYPSVFDTKLPIAQQTAKLCGNPMFSGLRV